MSYLFTCPHCQTKTQVDDRYSGHAGECVACGGAIQLPAFAGDRTSLTDDDNAKSGRWMVATVVAVILLACFVYAAVRLGGDTMNQLTANRERAASTKNLEKIAEAMNAYAADHGSYPPPFLRDSAGVKLQSWRVLILPYLGEEDLYNQFNLSLPWDDPNNMAAARDMPAVYRHPNSGVSGMFYESAYYLIVGNGTLFPSKTPTLGPNQIIDDPAQTLLVVEAKPLIPSGMWTEPIDLDFAKMNGNIGSNPGIEAGGLLEDGAIVVTTDGRGHFLPNSIDPTIFRALVTPKGGERLADDTLD